MEFDLAGFILPVQVGLSGILTNQASSAALNLRKEGSSLSAAVSPREGGIELKSSQNDSRTDSSFSQVGRFWLGWWCAVIPSLVCADVDIVIWA